MKTYRVVIERVEFYRVDAENEQQAESKVSEMGTYEAEWIETNTRTVKEV